jgi:hypothetical protein
VDAAQAKQRELTIELRRARGWILGVGIAGYVTDMIATWTSKDMELMPNEVKNWISLFAGAFLAVFVALWWFARVRPRTCCILALLIYWGLQTFAIAMDSSMLYKGILLKVLFTWALIKGIMSARRAATLKEELAEVFA